jgi:chorismate mutase
MNTALMNTATAATQPSAVQTSAVQTAVDAADRIGRLRTEIDDCDAAIIELVQRRRAAAGGTRLSLAREQQVLTRFRAALGPDGAALGMLLLRQGRGRL